MLSVTEIEARIRGELDGVVHVAVEDSTGTGDHFRALVVARGFEGRSRVEQHGLVFRALGDWMDGPVHALSLQTLTPEAWERRKAT